MYIYIRIYIYLYIFLNISIYIIVICYDSIVIGNNIMLEFMKGFIYNSMIEKRLYLVKKVLIYLIYFKNIEYYIDLYI